MSSSPASAHKQQAVESACTHHTTCGGFYLAQGAPSPRSVSGAVMRERDLLVSRRCSGAAGVEFFST
ncbi:unnamed protein product [Ectocarpus sp. CCAP 1310/34]|nr:unnamed protein product [Ectocarpus sp. CCAP 1310/34]